MGACALKLVLLMTSLFAFEGCGLPKAYDPFPIRDQSEDDPYLNSLPLPDRKIEPKLQPFLTEFRSLLQDQKINEQSELASLVLRDLMTGYAGYCVQRYTSPNSVKNQPRSLEGFVVIDTKLEGLQLRATIWHELGHCLLSLQHSQEPGIMSAFIPEEAALHQNWELFQANFFLLAHPF